MHTLIPAASSFPRHARQPAWYGLVHRGPPAPRRPHRAQAAAKRRRHSRGQLIRGRVRQGEEERDSKESHPQRRFSHHASASIFIEALGFSASHRRFPIGDRHWHCIRHIQLSFSPSTRLVIQRRMLRLQIDDLRADLGMLYYKKEVYTLYSRLQTLYSI